MGTQVNLICPNRNANVYYTLDGSSPTRRYDHVKVNNESKEKKTWVFIV